MTTIANRIQEGLNLKGWKQIDLVRATEISKSSIHTYITGEYEPKQTNIYKIAKALDVNEAWLMGLDVPKDRIAHPDSLSNQSKRLLAYYEQLSDIDKETIDMLAKRLASKNRD